MMKEEVLEVVEKDNNQMDKSISGEFVMRHDGEFFVIRNYDNMRPFFMTIVSANNHWLFLSSNGGLSAGRENPDSALFPYYTDDKITDMADVTGSKTIIRIKSSQGIKVWEPFNQHLKGVYNTTANLFKNRVGNKVVFQEINHDLGLTFEYSWSFSERYGIVKKGEIINNADALVQVELLDGIQNILPYGVSNALQNDRSTLVDAYKTAEWNSKYNLAIYVLSSMIVDKAEPSEALMATTVWSTGLEQSEKLVSNVQLGNFRRSGKVVTEGLIKAEKGAFYVASTLELDAKAAECWSIVAEVNQNHNKIVKLSKELSSPAKISKALNEDVLKNKIELRKKIGFADGIQHSADTFGAGRHFSNVLFNIMRGGIFEDLYEIETADFMQHIKRMNVKDYSELKPALKELPEYISYHQLRYFLTAARHSKAMRYYFEYLPISFSRRHGDPSRPWNYFSIELKDDEGNKLRSYEGNWRDIFQNWEALAFSFPEFSLGMISKFVNASTIDGYNPYRITTEGIDWEVIDPNDPWSHIGYWGDHQIIYLCKFLEFSYNHHPKRLQALLSSKIFSYANVPYRIKGYDAIVSDAKSTINYDHSLAKKIDSRVEKLGIDGKMVFNAEGRIELVNLTEKLLVMALTKIYNYIPDAGIWLNTQRPEWNDANNALVGNGVSMVTLYYLRRFLKFADKLFSGMEQDSFEINKPVVDLLDALQRTFVGFRPDLKKGFTDESRRQFMDSFGISGEHYRTTAYEGFSGEKRNITALKIKEFFEIANEYLEDCIELNERSDKLYHSYNLIHLTSDEVKVSHLYKMLEGQVAVLSSKFLSPEQSLNVLNALKASDMYREDQYSYMLYPNRELPTYLEKNTFDKADLSGSKLAAKLLDVKDQSVVVQDSEGKLHFNGKFNNAKDLSAALDNLKANGYRQLVNSDRQLFLNLFERVFEHKSFTGRSGAFYGYEGLGSIYWHMVSKLLLSIQENIYRAHFLGASKGIIGGLIEHYYEVRAGIGINKSPELYGAFPTDAYSHTPKYAGAKQPGMTGQVKEDVINRWAELGVVVNEGRISFLPILFRSSELVKEEGQLSYFNFKGEDSLLNVPANSMAFTYCQVPVIYSLSKKESITIHFVNGEKRTSDVLTLMHSESKSVYKREGKIEKIEVSFKSSSILN